jgi:peptidoglycan/LPS O-acetylase OafA/YrhL
MATLTQEIPTAPSPSAAPPKFRIHFLDGLRGFAALCVLLSHTFSLATYEDGHIAPSLPAAFVRATQILNYAHFAVAVFIVLSGFCLMLPVARSREGTLAGGLRGFVTRRARRILPPYYAALLLLLAFYVASHNLVKHTEQGADASAGSVITHLLLVHNFVEKWNMALDGPMWSVAWEWQIYFIFALVLLPLWRKTGPTGPVVLGFILGYLPEFALPEKFNFAWTCPWYLGLFAVGMAAATILTDQTGKYAAFKSVGVLHGIIAGGGLILAALLFGRPQWLEPPYYPVIDALVGLLTACFILACANSRSTGFTRAAVKIMESRPAMILGAFSYSLYLIHFPILNKARDVLARHGFSHFKLLLVLFVIGIPVCLTLSYLFHLVFERPFMPGRPKTERQAELAAVVSPAP